MHSMQKEILTKLGMALYLHVALIKKAEKARDAVDYLAERGVFCTAGSGCTPDGEQLPPS